MSAAMDREAVALLPCPFCGADASTRKEINRHRNDGEWDVECSNCAASVRMEYSEESAVAAWNRRAPPAILALTDARVRADQGSFSGSPSSSRAGSDPTGGTPLEPYTPVAIHFEEPDTLDFVERDIPTIARPVHAGLDVLLDMASREPVGWRIYGWSRIAPPSGEGWRPIETAPSERRVLINCQRFGVTEGFRYQSGWKSFGANGSYGAEPTHWQPLPAPPVSTAPRVGTISPEALPETDGPESSVPTALSDGGGSGLGLSQSQPSGIDPSDLTGQQPQHSDGEDA